MSVLKSRVFKGVWSIVTIPIVVALFLMLTTSYFNTKEINLLTSGCYENGGVVNMVIHNNLTGSYSFECEK
ncbi:hypothetical protein ACXYMX_03395 [Sporosarcina sp. CAU 1771]